MEGLNNLAVSNSFGLGREVEYYDLPSVRGIMREASADDYRWSSIILSIVKSMPFQMSIVPDRTIAGGGLPQ